MSPILTSEGAVLILECRRLLRAAWHAAGMARRALGTERGAWSA